ncbi:response regulator [Thalassotalea euphylliae]|uniref:Response regulator n=1 Tax=Thalassotalea euphylliae TaxID=1655234 RepID=A0A3E0TKS4_9GAMM|nr:response regulator [Thalassotalea euphylliae]REL25118.1 response regulator [Thalassotalea euphylliae]
MALSNYRDKRFLIIDSLKPSRDLLKQFAFNLDPEVVEACGYANDIVLRCAQTHYDVLLLGYNLGESQKNGQQLLEELRENGLVNRQSVVILITAENSQAMVLAALEHKPDDYLTKPYRIKDLRDRLERCYRKKHHMKSIYQALDSSDANTAIELCNQAIDSNSPYKAECYGIKSRQLFELQEYEQAATIYRQFKHQRNCQWATIGLGKIALKQQDFSGAINLFTNLVEQHPLYLSSYDWLATCYEAIEQYIKAQEVLETAIKISPLSVKRIERFAKLCFDNGEFDKATQAFEQNYQLSYNSIHHKPDNAFNFSESLNLYADELTSSELKQRKLRVINALNETNKTFKSPDTRVQMQLHSARIMMKTHEEYDAQRILNNSESYIDKVSEQLTSETLIKASRLLNELDRKEIANTLINLVVEREPDNADLMAEVDMLLDESLKREEFVVAQKALNQAAQYYRQQNYGQALLGLFAAQQLYPNHIGIKLNFVQVLLAYYQESKDSSKLNEANDLLASLVGLPSNHPAYQRYQTLNQQYKSLI